MAQQNCPRWLRAATMGRAACVYHVCFMEAAWTGVVCLGTPSSVAPTSSCHSYAIFVVLFERDEIKLLVHSAFRLRSGCWSILPLCFVDAMILLRFGVVIVAYFRCLGLHGCSSVSSILASLFGIHVI